MAGKSLEAKARTNPGIGQIRVGESLITNNKKGLVIFYDRVNKGVLIRNGIGEGENQSIEEVEFRVNSCYGIDEEDQYVITKKNNSKIYEEFTKKLMEAA